MDEDIDFEHQPVVGIPQAQYQQATSERPYDGRKLLDLVFIQDCTGSQGSYISSATRNIEEICNTIFTSGHLQEREDLRVGLVAYRDHPPQDHTWVYKTFPFTSNIVEVKDHLGTLYATGGGDGPEAVTAALHQALNMDWREHSTKMVVLIADAPPHGIGEYGDGFEDGSPDGYDPLQLVREMAQRGITLFFVACEPALSGYSYATDFYNAITKLTSGLMLPLTTADLLSHAIIGSVLENLDMDRLIREVGQAVAERILGANQSVDDVARELHERLLLRNENTKKVVIESIYRETPEAAHNVEVFMHAPNLGAARSLLKKVHGQRFTDKYLAARSHSAWRHHYPPVPPRSYASPKLELSSSPPTSTSPPRKVVTDFGTFSAPKTASVFGTAVQSSPFSLAGGKAAFGGIRNGGGMGTMDDDEDEDEGDGRQRVKLTESTISLDQAKRIAMQSAWRSMRA